MNTSTARNRNRTSRKKGTSTVNNGLKKKKLSSSRKIANSATPTPAQPAEMQSAATEMSPLLEQVQQVQQPAGENMQQQEPVRTAATEMSPLLEQVQTENMQPPVTEMQNPENVQPPVTEMQNPENVQPLVTEMQPIIADEQKEEDTIKTALLEQLRKIKEQTAQIENQLASPAAVGGMMKKRKKTYYKRYKSKKSMKRKNKTSRNN